MARPRTRRPVAALLILCLPQAGGALADAMSCPGLAVTVEAPDAATAARVCASAARAVKGLATCNVDVPDGVAIRVTDDLESGCFGIYHCNEGLIELLPPAIIANGLRPESPFAGLSNSELFDSVLVHELSHAAFDAVPCPFDLCTGTAEYVAHAMQVRSLTADQIAAFEAADPVDERVSHDAINAILYAFSPDRFASLAWAHFTQRPDGCGYIGQIMSGAILFDRALP